MYNAFAMALHGAIAIDTDCPQFGVFIKATDATNVSYCLMDCLPTFAKQSNVAQLGDALCHRVHDQIHHEDKHVLA
jgi:hypothetical protein